MSQRGETETTCSAQGTNRFGFCRRPTYTIFLILLRPLLCSASYFSPACFGFVNFIRLFSSTVCPSPCLSRIPPVARKFKRTKAEGGILEGCTAIAGEIPRVSAPTLNAYFIQNARRNENPVFGSYAAVQSGSVMRAGGIRPAIPPADRRAAFLSGLPPATSAGASRVTAQRLRLFRLILRFFKYTLSASMPAALRDGWHVMRGSRFPFSCCAYVHATPRSPPSSSYNVVDAALTPVLFLYSARLIRVFMRRAWSFSVRFYFDPLPPCSLGFSFPGRHAEGRFSSGRVPRAACHITHPKFTNDGEDAGAEKGKWEWRRWWWWWWLCSLSP
nr:uncharacterized protein LOC129380978 [Dermacentor andersoni]